MIPTTQLENESTKAYEAFRCYLDMGEKRSVRNVAKKVHKSSRLIGRYSSRFQWVERIRTANFDDANMSRDATGQAKLEIARKKEALQLRVKERGEILFDKLSAKAEQLLQLPAVRSVTKDGKTTVEPANAAFFSAAARLVDSADRIGRLTAEMPTSLGELTGKDGKPLIPTVQPILNYIITEDANSRAARARFGEIPKKVPQKTKL
jgi:hypothetical protein